MPFWKTKQSKFPLMIIVVLGMACVSLGSLGGICDFIRGLNFRSEVGLRSGKHVFQVFAIAKLSLWTQSSSASTLRTAVSSWDKQREEEKPKKPNVTAVVACRYLPPCVFLLSNPTTYHPLSQLHATLWSPWSPSPKLQFVLQQIDEDSWMLLSLSGEGSASAGCTAHPSCPPYTGSQVIAQIPHRLCRLYLTAATGHPCKRRNQRRGRTQKKSLLFQQEVHAFKYSVSRKETNETAASMEGRSAQDWVGSWLHSAVGGGRALREFTLWFF